jgi:hypothetical protein
MNICWLKISAHLNGYYNPLEPVTVFLEHYIYICTWENILEVRRNQSQDFFQFTRLHLPDYGRKLFFVCCMCVCCVYAVCVRCTLCAVCVYVCSPEFYFISWIRDYLLMLFLFVTFSDNLISNSGFLCFSLNTSQKCHIHCM